MMKTLAAMALAVAMAGAGAAWAEDPAGDWKGVVTTPGGPLHVAVHLHASGAGAYAGTADSPDQGAYDLPLSKVIATAETMSFELPVAHASYAGKWDPTAHQWTGSFTQGGGGMPLNLTRGVLPAGPVIAGLDGDWNGVLSVGPGMRLRLVFHIKTGPHGTVVKMDSVDQGAFGSPVPGFTRKGDHISVIIDAIGVDYEADLKDGGKTIVGTFTQGPQSFPLTLTLGAPGSAPPPLPVVAPPEAAGWSAPTDAAIDQILNERIDVQKQGVGIVVGLIDAHGHRRFISEGGFDQADDRPVGADTLFEMGSITKVFTATLLTQAVERGEVKLDDPVAKYLPAGVHMPERGDKQITLRDLAQHMSGLPRMPTNFAPKDIDNPYADYTDDQLFAFLNSYTLPRDIGSKWEYSNLGVGLLGEVLARRAGMSYEALLKTRILDPLGMTSSGITLTPDEKRREAIGHDAYLRRTAYWDLAALSGAGALRSDANDMLTFLAANIGLTSTPLKSAMDATLAVKRIPNLPDNEQALGWDVRHSPYGDIIWHNGGTGGFRTMIAFNPKEKVGVVVLTNASTAAGGDDIAFHILAGAPLTALTPPGSAPDAGRTAITLPQEKLEALVGNYEMGPGISVTVTRTDNHLFAQIKGQSAYELFPESSTNFFFKVVDAQVTFTLGPDGRATGFVLHQNGKDMPGKRAP
jgi:D-alanyl-D-alanine-carboxypeptidase/D-alanyl-D-alanine-endopeptidase